MSAPARPTAPWGPPLTSAGIPYEGVLAAGPLDELRLLVHPISARRGERLFDEGEPVYPLRLLRSETFPTGVVRLVYAPGDLPGTQTYDDVTDKVPGARQG